MITFGRNGTPCCAQRASIFSQENPGREIGEGGEEEGFDGIAAPKAECRQSTPLRSLIIREQAERFFRREVGGLIHTAHFEDGDLLPARFQGCFGILEIDLFLPFV